MLHSFLNLDPLLHLRPWTYGGNPQCSNYFPTLVSPRLRDHLRMWALVEKPHSGIWSITETHSEWDQNICTTSVKTILCDCWTVRGKSWALLLMYVFGLHKHTIKTQCDRLWREAADGLSLFFFLFTYPPTGRHLLEPRLLMRQMKGTALLLLLFPSSEKCFFSILILLAARTFDFSETAPCPLLDCRRPSLPLWQNRAPPRSKPSS